MGCENMDKRKKVSKRNNFRIKHILFLKKNICDVKLTVSNEALSSSFFLIFPQKQMDTGKDASENICQSRYARKGNARDWL